MTTTYKDTLEALMGIVRAHVSSQDDAIAADQMEEELRAKLDALDRRTDYMRGYIGTLHELSRVHDALGYPMEAGCIRGKMHAIEKELEQDDAVK